MWRNFRCVEDEISSIQLWNTLQMSGVVEGREFREGLLNASPFIGGWCFEHLLKTLFPFADGDPRRPATATMGRKGGQQVLLGYNLEKFQETCFASGLSFWQKLLGQCCLCTYHILLSTTGGCFEGQNYRSVCWGRVREEWKWQICLEIPVCMPKTSFVKPTIQELALLKTTLVILIPLHSLWPMNNIE